MNGAHTYIVTGLCSFN